MYTHACVFGVGGSSARVPGRLGKGYPAQGKRRLLFLDRLYPLVAASLGVSPKAELLQVVEPRGDPSGVREQRQERGHAHGRVCDPSLLWRKRHSAPLASPAKCCQCLPELSMHLFGGYGVWSIYLLTGSPPTLPEGCPCRY